MKPGDVITIRAFHADGRCYRNWQAEVEEADDNCIVTLFHPGCTVDDQAGLWISPWHIRTYYWLDQPYNLMEIYDPPGMLLEIYVNVASVPVLKDGTLEFSDYELDVSLLTGQPARIIDEDEFAAAIISYGYSPEFQAHCRQIAAAALQLAQNWTAKGLGRAESI